MNGLVYFPLLEITPVREFDSAIRVVSCVGECQAAIKRGVVLNVPSYIFFLPRIICRKIQQGCISIWSITCCVCPRRNPSGVVCNGVNTTIHLSRSSAVNCPP